MNDSQTIEIKNDEFGDYSPQQLVRDGRCVDCKCRRCRHKWMEIDDTKHTNGTGNAGMCQRCLSSAIDRIRYYKKTNL